jgi:hypothetical protein
MEERRLVESAVEMSPAERKSVQNLVDRCGDTQGKGQARSIERPITSEIRRAYPDVA